MGILTEGLMTLLPDPSTREWTEINRADDLQQSIHLINHDELLHTGTADGMKAAAVLLRGPVSNRRTLISKLHTSTCVTPA